jgi:CheY-like chemotaxis protein
VIGEEHLLRVEVVDTGIGIPVDRRNGLFLAFSQIDESISHRFGGTGLGLAISKQLTEMMGGQISVESKVGHGSTFSFTLKYRALNAPASPGNQLPFANMRALIVDAGEVGPNILRRQLGDLGFNADVASSGNSALQKLESGSRYDIVLLDCKLPGMEGLSLARKIMNLPDCKNLPLALLTTMDCSIDNALLRVCGFKGVITKPIRQSKLVESIEIALGYREPAPVCHPALVVDKARRARAGTILVAEDNPVNQVVISELLRILGYNFEVVEDGEMAVSAFRRAKYDLILMDCQMPKMGGIEATRQIRAEETRRQTPSRIQIVALSANAQRSSQEECIEAGMDFFCTKPIDLKKLTHLLDGSLKESSPCPECEGLGLETEMTPGGIDVDLLLGRCGNRPSVAKLVLIKFSEQLARDLDDLQKSIDQRDIEWTLSIAHALRGASNMAGAIRLSSAVSRLEKLAPAGNFREVESILASVQIESSECLKGLSCALTSLDNVQPIV